MVKDSPYYIGKPPIFDPCEKCIVKACCTQICKDKIMYVKGYKPAEKLVVTIKKMKRRRKK